MTIKDEMLETIGSMLIALGADHSNDKLLTQWDVDLEKALVAGDEAKLRDLMSQANEILGLEEVA